MSEQKQDALDEEALEASTVIERPTSAVASGPVRLSPLQPLARVEAPAIRTPATPELRTVLPESGPAPAEPPPLQLLRPGTEPARPLADPWPTGTARRSQAPRARGAARPAGGRRLLLVVVAALGFAAGVLVRDRWPAGGGPASSSSATGAPGAVGGAPVRSPAPVVASPPPPVSPVPASPRPGTAQKRKRGVGF